MQHVHENFPIFFQETSHDQRGVVAHLEASWRNL